jgi:hypothetical protein
MMLTVSRKESEAELCKIYLFNLFEKVQQFMFQAQVLPSEQKFSDQDFSLF